MDERERLSEQISAVRRQLWAKQLDWEEVRRELDLACARHQLTIADALDAQGRRRYQNTDTRRAALTVALAEDTEYQQLVSGERVLRMATFQLGEDVRSLLFRLENGA